MVLVYLKSSLNQLWWLALSWIGELSSMVSIRLSFFIHQKQHSADMLWNFVKKQLAAAITVVSSPQIVSVNLAVSFFWGLV
jgi:hypothetical protein